MSRFFASLWTTARQAPLLRDSPGKNTGVGCHLLLQGISPTQGSHLHPVRLLTAGGFFTTAATVTEIVTAKPPRLGLMSVVLPSFLTLGLRCFLAFCQTFPSVSAILGTFNILLARFLFA